MQYRVAPSNLFGGGLACKACIFYNFFVVSFVLQKPLGYPESIEREWISPPIDIDGPKQPQVLRHHIHVTDNCRLTSRFSSIRPHDSGKAEELAWNSPIFFRAFFRIFERIKGI